MPQSPPSSAFQAFWFAPRVLFWPFWLAFRQVSGQSRWTHPDHEIFQGLERLHREATAAADPAAHLRRGWAAMDAEAKRAEAQWSGPQVTEARQRLACVFC